MMKLQSRLCPSSTRALGAVAFSATATSQESVARTNASRPSTG
jgi:hypothetical protein